MDTFQSLVNPHRSIPYFVQQLTGITDDMVQDSPGITELKDDLRAFIGDDPIVGQNIRFDLGFLLNVGLEFDTDSFDTSRLARLLIPHHNYGGLAGLAEGLGVDFRGESHRALSDAETTAAVFVELCNRIAVVSGEERLRLARLVASESSGLAMVIAGTNDYSVGTEEMDMMPLPEVLDAPNRLEPIKIQEEIDPIDFRKVFDGSQNIIERFEKRSQQLDMAKVVKKALDTEGRFLIEAGTGVGKSLAYLLPAALFAIKNGKHVVISTNTIALQEQIITKDLPTVRKILLHEGIISDPDDFRTVLLKGRSNYLCTKRWLEYPKALNDSDISGLAASLALWLPETKTGDRAELRLTPNERSTWNRFCAEGTECLSEHNSFVREGRCFLARARQDAEAAHVIVVNHALLLADAKSGGNVIPNYDYLILDEAHNLEQQATQQFGISIGARDVHRVLDTLHGTSSSGNRASGLFSAEVFPETASLPGTTDIRSAIDEVRKNISMVFEGLHAVVEEQGVAGKLLLTSVFVVDSSWESLTELWVKLDQSIKKLVSLLKAHVILLEAESVPKAKIVKNTIVSAVDSIAELAAQIETFFIDKPDLNTIGWVSNTRKENVMLNNAPIAVGPVLDEMIFSRCTSVVATSATLTVDDSTTFAAQSIGLAEAEPYVLGSPFNYEKTTLLASVTNIPDPRESGYSTAAAHAIEELVSASRGRALVLLTSHAAIRELSSLVMPILEKAGITVLRQGIDGTPARLVEYLKEHPQSVIFGTASLWEGIDIRGDALSLLIIAKLPFGDPTDPVHKARGALYGNSFLEYSLPSSILRFRQGFGRLIRDRSDVGVVAILDSRLRTKRYGPSFLKALPVCTERTGNVGYIAEEIKQWLSQ